MREKKKRIKSSKKDVTCAESVYMHGTLALKTTKTNTENNIASKNSNTPCEIHQVIGGMLRFCRWNLKSIGKYFLMQRQFWQRAVDVLSATQLFVCDTLKIRGIATLSQPTLSSIQHYHQYNAAITALWYFTSCYFNLQRRRKKTATNFLQNIFLTWIKRRKKNPRNSSYL